MSRLQPFNLPQELIDMVVDHLYEDIPALQALGLVSRQWRQRTRENLFDSIVVGSFQPRTECVELELLLESNPSLHKFIKELRIEEIADEDSGWLTEPDTPLLRVLPLLTSLTSLIIEGVETCLQWETVSPDLQIALYELMAQPQITSIKLAGIENIDLTPFAQYNQLVSLTLEYIFPIFMLYPLNAPSSPLGQKTTSLRTLAGHACSTALLKLLTYSRSSEATLDMTNITELQMGTIQFTSMQGEELWEMILDRCCANVETYHVIQETSLPLEEADPFPLCLFAFDRIPKLTSLNFVLQYHTFDNEDQYSLPGILAGLDQLSRLAKPSMLSEINLTIDFEEMLDTDETLDIDNHLDQFIEQSCDAFWGNLDAILAPKAFPNLREVNVFLDATGCEHTFSAMDDCKRWILVCMPNLHGCDMLSVLDFGGEITRYYKRGSCSTIIC